MKFAAKQQQNKKEREKESKGEGEKKHTDPRVRNPVWALLAGTNSELPFQMVRFNGEFNNKKKTKKKYKKNVCFRTPNVAVLGI